MEKELKGGRVVYLDMCSGALVTLPLHRQVRACCQFSLSSPRKD